MTVMCARKSKLEDSSCAAQDAKGSSAFLSDWLALGSAIFPVGIAHLGWRLHPPLLSATLGEINFTKNLFYGVKGAFCTMANMIKYSFGVEALVILGVSTQLLAVEHPGPQH